MNRLVWLLTFTDPSWFFALGMLPVLSAFYLLTQKRFAKRVLSFGDPLLLGGLTTKGYKVRAHLKFILIVLSLTFLVAELARPRLLYRTSLTKPADVALVLDLSRSMLAADIKPNRLSAVKNALHTILERLDPMRTAVIGFAGESVLIVPLTTDRKTVYGFLDLCNTSTIPAQGTNLAPALRLAAESLHSLANRTRFILLFTDGEDHEGGALQEAAVLKNQKTQLVVVGVGTIGGSPVPDLSGGFKKDKAHNLVISRYKPGFLDSLARSAGGFFTTLDPNDIDQPVNAMDTLLSKVPKIYQEEVHDLSLPVFLFFGLSFLLAEFLTSGEGKKLPSRAAIAFISAACLIPVKGSAQSFYHNARKGVDYYQKGLFSRATKAFMEDIPEGKPSPVLNYDLGTSLYQEHNYHAAEKNLREALNSAQAGKTPNGSDDIRSMAAYNLGNALFKQGRYRESINAYLFCLHQVHSDHDALYNLAFARYMIHRPKMIPPKANLIKPQVHQVEVPRPREPGNKGKPESSNTRQAGDGKSLLKDW